MSIKKIWVELASSGDGKSTGVLVIYEHKGTIMCNLYELYEHIPNKEIIKLNFEGIADIIKQHNFYYNKIPFSYEEEVLKYAEDKLYFYPHLVYEEGK